MASDDRAPYRRHQIEGLVNGSFVGDYDVWFGAETWAAIRSRVERHGDVEDPDYMAALDLERALVLLASPISRDGRHARVQIEFLRAATLISARLMTGMERHELAALVPRGVDAERLVRKGAAWIAAYLSGKDLDECERKFRRTR